MNTVQILLPVYSAAGNPFPKEYFKQLRTELTEKFGGITTYTRSPATGFWKEDETTMVKDDIIIFEVMTEDLEKPWWTAYREKLEVLFKQDEIIIRAWHIETL